MGSVRRSDSLLEQGEVDEELWDVDHALQVEVVLAAEQRVVALVLERHAEHLVTKRAGGGRLHTLPGGREGAGEVVILQRKLTQFSFIVSLKRQARPHTHTHRRPYTSSYASGVVPMKKPPGRSLSQAFLSIMSACCCVSNE